MKSKTQSTLPICSKKDARKLNSCVKKIEKRNIKTGYPKEGLGTKEAPIPYAVCRTSIGCRLGMRKR